MAPIVLEDMEQVLFEKLNDLARIRRVSIEQQIVMVLEDALRRPDRDTLIHRADAIAAMTPIGVPQTDSTVLIREDRDR